MNPLLLSAYLTLFGSDAITTHIALTQPSQTLVYQERNPLLTSNPWANDAILAGTATFVFVATKPIQNPWLRWSVRLGVAGFHGYIAYRNYHQLQRR